MNKRPIYALVLCTLVAVRAPAIAQESRLDSVLAEYARAHAAMSRVATADRQARLERLIGETADRIDIGSLGVFDLFRLVQMGFTQNAGVEAKLAARLYAIQPTAPLDRAGQAWLRVFFAARPPAPAKPYGALIGRLLDAALSEPATVALIASPKGAAFAMPLYDGLHAAAGDVAPRVERVSRLLREDRTAMSPDTAGWLMRYWDVVTERMNQSAAGFEAARSAMASAVSLALKDPGVAPRRKYLEGALEYLEGAAMMGRLLGKPAPAVDVLWSSEPGVKTLGDLRGKVVYLDFFATWCGPCIASFPEVKKLQERFAGRPVAIVGVTSLQGAVYGLGQTISCKDDPAKEMGLMPEFIKAKAMSWPVVITKQDCFNPAFGIRSIPHVAILDAAGRVRYNGLPEDMPLDRRAALIDGLLAEGTPK